METLQTVGTWFASPSGQVAIVIAVFALTIVAFIADKVRSDIVALSSLALLLVTNVLTPSEALAGFSNSAVVMMIGLFVVGGAVFQTGLARTISGRLLKLAGTSEVKLFFLVMIVTSVVAAFVSNTGTVALLLPIILAMAKSAGTSPAKLMMPLAFASSMGGILTLIGTPPNLIVDGYLRDNGREALPSSTSANRHHLLCGGFALLYPLCRFMLGKKAREGADSRTDNSLADLLHEYHIADLVFRLKAQSGSMHLEGMTVGELDIRHQYGITILEVRRANHTIFSSSIQEAVTANTVLQADDTFYVLGHREQVEAFAADHNLSVFEDEEREGKAKLDFYEIGLAEVLISPDSSLINRTLRTANFRERFGVNVLAVKRQGNYLFENVLDAPVKNGDMLLVHGEWKALRAWPKRTASGL